MADLYAPVAREQASTTPPAGELVPTIDATAPHVLDVRDLWVHYRSGRLARRRAPGAAAVQGISLDVRAGEVVGLVGESGSGKSTVALAALDLIARTSGSVSVCGSDLAGLRGRTSRAARLDCQLVFQDPYSSLDPRQRVGAGLAELRRLHRERTAWMSDDEVLERVGLTPSATLGRYVHQLSGGQIQRVVLARALLLRPRLLIADEPTSSLDVSVQAQILQLLQTVRRDHGIAMLFISHDLRVVRHLCDRVNVMRQGQIVEHGDTESVFSSPAHEYTRALIAAIPSRSLQA